MDLTITIPDESVQVVALSFYGRFPMQIDLPVPTIDNAGDVISTALQNQIQQIIDTSAQQQQQAAITAAVTAQLQAIDTPKVSVCATITTAQPAQKIGG